MNLNFYSRLLSLAAALGVVGVGMGAFGAHFLRSRLDDGAMEALRTGVLYLFVHVLGMLAIVVLGKSDMASRLLKSIGILFGIGIFLFSGSLFLIATQTLTGLSALYYGFVTPLGGMCFIAGWVLLFIYPFLANWHKD